MWTYSSKPSIILSVCFLLVLIALEIVVGASRCVVDNRFIGTT